MSDMILSNDVEAICDNGTFKDVKEWTKWAGRSEWGLPALFFVKDGGYFK